MAKTSKKKVGRKPRRSRKPFGARRTKLQVEPIKGFVLRWFNDVDGRVERAQEGGYEFVQKGEIENIGEFEIHQDNSDVNSKVSKVVSRGEPVIRAYLMKIKQAWYDEDQAAKEAVNRQVDESLRQGTPGGNVVDNQYVPEGHKHTGI